MGDLKISTNSGAATVVDEAKVDAFRAGLRGQTWLAGNGGYDAARAVWNGSIDKRPAIVARCSGVADVIDAVNFARDNDMAVAVRGGGHNIAGHSACDGGLVIDLGALNSVRVDVAARRVRAGGGALIGDVDREAQAFGLAVPLGIVSETGIGGLTLCGGHSWLCRKHGFACDNLLSVDMVTADGRYLHANEDENSDLFWAVRGGGGNFGVVTSFEFAAHSVGPEIMFCAPIFAMADAEAVFRGWRDFVGDLPDEFTTQIAFWSIPAHEGFPAEFHGQDVVITSGVHCGPVAEGERFVQPLRELATPLLDLSGPIPYVAAQQAFDPFFTTKGERQNYWKSLYLDTLDDAAMTRIIARARNRPDPWSLIPIRHMGGAAGRVPPGATPLGGRDATFMLSIDTSWTDPAIAWTRDFWDEMRQGTDGGIYLNFIGDGEDNEATLRAAYGNANYERLVDVKTKHDPQNLFRLNQNIAPKVA